MSTSDHLLQSYLRMGFSETQSIALRQYRRELGVSQDFVRAEDRKRYERRVWNRFLKEFQGAEGSPTQILASESLPDGHT